MSPLSNSASSQRAPSASGQSSNVNTRQPPTPSAKSESIAFTELEPDLYEMEDELEIGGGEAVQFCLLAEFDIDAGATLTDQYPHPTGTDEQ
jgi:hypothetical protein